MSIWQGVLIFIFASISGIGSSTEEFQTHRPLISSTLIGLALGDVKTGIMAGASMEMVALGWMTIGAVVPPDPAISGVTVAILCILCKQNIGVAIGVAIPIAVTGQLLQIMQKSILDVGVMHWAERGVEKGKISRITIAHILTGIPSALRVSIPAVVLAYFADVSVVQNLLNAIPKSITVGLQISSGFLVVVGYAMIMQLINVKELLPFFFIGFLIMTFTKMTLVGLSILGTSFACIYYYFLTLICKRDKRIGKIDTESIKDNLENRHKIKITKKDLIKVFWRTQIYQLSWNYERLQNLSYCFCIMPILKKLYKSKKELVSAIKVHLEYFNTHPFFSSTVLGVNIALEEAMANDDSIDKNTSAEIKVALMGPLAGIGDPIFWGTIRPLTAAIGAGIASTGNPAGPIIFFLVINGIRLFMRYNLLMFSYKGGVNIILKMKNFTPKMKNFMSILAYTIIGGLTAKWTSINVPVVLYSYVKRGKIIYVTVQQQLDYILPNMIPLLLTFIIYVLLKKKISPLVCMLGLMILGILGYVLGILA